MDNVKVFKILTSNHLLLAIVFSLPLKEHNLMMATMMRWNM